MLKFDDVETVLERCATFHGHLCLGQVVGVRMAKKGLELVAAEDIKDLIVMVEKRSLHHRRHSSWPPGPDWGDAV